MTHWTDFLRGSNGGEFDRLIQPAPYATAPNLVDGAWLNIKQRGQLRCRDRRVSDRAHLSFSKLSPVSPLPSKAGSMLDLIGHVFFGSRPTQVVRPVVKWIAVIVSDLVLRAWRGAVERFADQSMHCAVDGLAIADECNLCVAHAATAAPLIENPPRDCPATWMATGRISADPPKARDAIVGRTWNCHPKLFRVDGISHGAVPSRSWSGPRGVASTVAARCFSSRIMLCSQPQGVAR
jgi:hypothetical protein